PPKGAGHPQHLVDLPKPSDPTLEPPVLLDHVGGRPIMPPAAVGLVMTDPVGQGLGADTQLLSQPADHRLRIRLPVPAHHSYAQLAGVFLQPRPPSGSRPTPHTTP